MRRARQSRDLAGRVSGMDRVSVSHLCPGGHRFGKEFLHLGGIFGLDRDSKVLDHGPRACSRGGVGPVTTVGLTNFFKGGRVTSGLKLCHSAEVYLFQSAASTQ